MDKAPKEPSQKNSTLLFNLNDVQKNLESEGVAFHLSIPKLQIAHGEKIALIGDSGCGKSTLLDMLVFISRPTHSGTFHFHAKPTNAELVDIGMQWQKRHPSFLTQQRKQHIGYVMQTGGLLPFLNVRDNMNLSRHVLGLPEDDTVADLARELKIDRHLDKLPDALSIGERQRVAIGRALAHKPAVVIADEPTASLDPYSAKATMTLFVNLVDDLGVTLIIASHAWEHLRKFGLQRLYHNTRHSEQRTESTVIG